MTPLPNDIPSSQEIIKKWIFREKGGIFIPKEDRKTAAIIQVDIKVVSVSRAQYVSYEVLPPDSYYGYATVVLRDCALPPIKISQPRQTLFFERNDSAIELWWQYFYAIQQQSRFQGVESLVCDVIGRLGGACAAKPCVPVIPPSFNEIPLREVYVNSHYGTQFEIEFSYWRFLPLLDNCGNLVLFDSGQTDDSEKDGGLPPNGAMPNNASPESPYQGLPLPSTIGDSPTGLLDGKWNGLGNVNPENIPEPPIGTVDGRSYNVTVQFTVTYYNSAEQEVGSTAGEVYFPDVIGAIQSIYENPDKQIRGGEYVGIVARDVLIRDKNGVQEGVLIFTNIFEPYAGAFNATKWMLFGITGFIIGEN